MLERKRVPATTLSEMKKKIAFKISPYLNKTMRKRQSDFESCLRHRDELPAPPPFLYFGKNAHTYLYLYLIHSLDKKITVCRNNDPLINFIIENMSKIRCKVREKLDEN